MFGLCLCRYLPTSCIEHMAVSFDENGKAVYVGPKVLSVTLHVSLALYLVALFSGSQAVP